MITEPGIYLDHDIGEYLADPCPTPSLNQSGIPTLLERSPYHFAYQHPRLNPYGGEAVSLEKGRLLGDAVHRLALGRGREISVIRYRDYATGAARGDRDEAIRNNRIPVLEHEFLRAQDMAEILQRQISQVLGGASYYTEVLLVWTEETEHGPVWLRALLDVWCPERATALDPKALRIAAVPEAFGRTASENGYDIQNRFYSRGLGAVLPDMAGRIKFANLVVESSPPYGAQTMELGPGSAAIADWKIEYAIARFGRCLHTRSWPSYPRAIQTYETPPYYQQREIARQAARQGEDE